MRLYYDDIKTITVENIQEECHFYYQSKRYTVSPSQATIHLDEKLELGKQIFFHDDYGRSYAVYPRFIVHSDYFEEHYTDEETKLGAYYQNGFSYFHLWAPTAHRVFLHLEGKIYSMKSLDKGVYSYECEGNLHGQSYFYEIHIADTIYKSEDPYALASLPNREASVFCDLEKLSLNIQKGPERSQNETILEVHTRDFSMDPKHPFQNRGKFLSLIESHGQAGYAHVLDLGVDWIQLMPVNDFATVDEYEPEKRYNWGYDPMQFFVLEGSYSSNIHNPFQVMEDFAKVIDRYHRDGFKVSLDVVLNHVYESEESSFHKTVPYYYFRYNQDGFLSNGSFCGNELATERKMLSRFIVEVCEYFVTVFKIDGFRFDLMGLIDIKTMQAIQERLPNTFLYGEGWSMPSLYEEVFYARLSQAKKQKFLAYFNDRTRDYLAGTLDASQEGILDYKNVDVSKLAFYLLGDLKKMHDSQQNIHYIECHDNLSLADRLSIQNHGPQEARFLTEVLLLFEGYVLLQIGQSFFRTKHGDANSYRSSDAINHVDWSQLEKNKDLNQAIKNAIMKRKQRGALKDIDFEKGSITVYYEKLEAKIDLVNREVIYFENLGE